MATTVDQLAAKSQANNDAAAAALEGFNSQMASVVQTAKKSAEEAAQAQTLVTTTAGIATQKAQQATLDQATALGTNPDAANFILNKVAKEYEQNNARAQKFAENVAYASDITNITDSPLKYIGSLITLELNQQGQASAERAASRSFQQYTGLNNMTQEFGQTQAAIAQSVTPESVAAQAKVAAFNLNAMANQAELQAIQLNSKGVIEALKLKNDAFDIERQRQASANDEERMRMARQAAAKQNIEMDLRIAAGRRAEARDKKQEDKLAKAEQVENDIVNIVNTAASATELPMKFNSIEELNMARASPQFKDKIDMLYNIGLQSVYSSRVAPDGAVTPNLVISDSPSKTLSFVKGMGAKLSPGQQPIVGLLDSQLTDLQNTNKDFAKMKPEERTMAFDGAVKTTAADMYRNVGNQEGNIYAPPPLGTFLGNAEFVAGAPSIAAVMKTQSDLGVKNVDFGKLTAALTDAAKSGKMPLGQIDSELKFFAQKTMAINNSLRRYEETAGLPRMKNVNVKLSLPAKMGFGRADTLDIFGGGDESVMVDLADDTKRQAYLNKLYSRNIPDVLRQQAAKTGERK
jgi:hypothetical protein